MAEARGDSPGESENMGESSSDLDPLNEIISHLQDLNPVSSAAEPASSPERLGSEDMREWFRIGREASSILELRPLLTALLERFLAITEGGRGFIMLDWRQRQMEVAHNLAETDLTGHNLAVSHTILADVAESGRSVFVPETIGQSVYGDRSSILELKIRSFCCVPMMHEGKVVGLCYTDSKKPGRRLEQREIGLLEAFAEQSAVAIANARKHEKVVDEREHLKLENAALRSEVRQENRFGKILGKSKPMLRLFHTIEKFTRSNAPVLILGETGTGKELVAKALHYNGSRSEHKLLAVNCSSIPESLFESAFFGHKKGAFTGAVADQQGHFLAASGGTLFLDEVGELSITVQAKLLRALQEGECTPIGETNPVKFDVRVIAATHRNLDSMVAAETFRQDLLYRLKVLQLEIPALRDREHDVILLAEHFMKRDSAAEQKSFRGFDATAAKLMLEYEWPGNIRELENCIHFAVAVAEPGDTIQVQHLPQVIGETLQASSLDPSRRSAASGRDSQPGLGAAGAESWQENLDSGSTLKETLASMEALMVTHALQSNQGVVARTAAKLGVSRQHLHSLIRKHNLKPSD